MSHSMRKTPSVIIRVIASGCIHNNDLKKKNPTQPTIDTDTDGRRRGTGRVRPDRSKDFALRSDAARRISPAPFPPPITDFPGVREHGNDPMKCLEQHVFASTCFWMPVTVMASSCFKVGRSNPIVRRVPIISSHRLCTEDVEIDRRLWISVSNAETLTVDPLAVQSGPRKN
ncbi:hypothetical protein K3495_g428 [Podosphaera aphanis]|nr:hypothetical protein K3495_g428 [Podosphaera aphanis]